MKLLTLSLLIALIFGPEASAQTIVAANAIRARALITASDITTIPEDVTGGMVDPSLIVGMEARVNLYPGRPIRLSDVGKPAILERNQMVVMIYRAGLLAITAEGQVMGRAGVGESVRVMNMDSRMTVTGIVMANGTIEVSP